MTNYRVETTQRELGLGICHVRAYLYRRPFLLRADHATLTWLLNFKEPEGQLAWWLETLQDYDVQELVTKLSPR